MKHEFDIWSYKKAGDEYNDKLIYVNQCIRRANQKTIRNVINELRFIRLQIREFCTMDQVFWPQNIPTGRKGISVNDAAILNFINEQINYYTELDSIGDQVIKKTTDEILPSLPDCFNDKEYFWQLIQNPRIADYYTILDNGSYNWIANKDLLAGLAVTLLRKDKLSPVIKTNQDLARVFCPFFNVKYNEKEEKSFQQNRAKTYLFDFIR